MRVGFHEDVNDFPLSANPAPFRMVTAVAFGLMHLAGLRVFVTGANVLVVTLFGVVSFLQMIGLIAGYDCSFAHRVNRTSRAFQFVLASLGAVPPSGGRIWWAAQPRRHHRTLDTLENLGMENCDVSLSSCHHRGQ